MIITVRSLSSPILLNMQALLLNPKTTSCYNSVNMYRGGLASQLQEWAFASSREKVVAASDYSWCPLIDHFLCVSVYLQYIFPFMYCRKCMDAIERLVFTAATAIIVVAASDTWIEKAISG